MGRLKNQSKKNTFSQKGDPNTLSVPVSLSRLSATLFRYIGDENNSNASSSQRISCFLDHQSLNIKDIKKESLESDASDYHVPPNSPVTPRLT